MHQSGDVLQQRYHIDRALGAGGMGGVYLATHRALDAKVAIKEMTLHVQSDEDRIAAVRQFKKEAQILHHLHHANLPRVHDFFEEQGKYYLVMDYIEGRSLESIFQDDPLSEDELHRYNRSLCEVLQYLHTYNPPIIFRDLKPSNIMLADHGGIKLIDFGIAKDFDTKTGRGTQTSVRGAGTPGFAAPEQYGAGSDVRTDVYALGATLYTLLTAQRPPDSLDIAAGVADLKPLHELRPDVTPETGRVIEWMMSVNRNERPACIQDVAIAFGYGAQAAFSVLPQRVLDQIQADRDHFNPNVTRRPARVRQTRRVEVPAPPSVAADPDPTLPPVRAALTAIPPALVPRRRSKVPAAVSSLAVVALLGTALGMSRPHTVTVHLDSDPQGASVVVNHSPGPVTPCDVPNVPDNAPLHVELTLHGYDDLDVDLPAKASAPVLHLKPATAFLKVSGSPKASLQVDGRDVDQVGSVESEVPLSPDTTHKVRLHAEGYADYDTAVRLKIGETTATLQYQLKADQGSLTLLAPSGSRVTLNGKARGTVAGGALTIPDLAAGNYPLVVDAPGYEKLKTAVAILHAHNQVDCGPMLHRLAQASALPTPATVTLLPPPAAPTMAEIVPGQRLGRFALGEPAASVTPGLTDEGPREGGELFSTADGLYVHVKDGKVHGLGARFPVAKAALLNGLGGGATTQQVMDAYGAPAWRKDTFGHTMMVYRHQGVRFMLGPQQTVVIINVFPPD